MGKNDLKNLLAGKVAELEKVELIVNEKRNQTEAAKEKYIANKATYDKLKAREEETKKKYEDAAGSITSSKLNYEKAKEAIGRYEEELKSYENQNGGTRSSYDAIKSKSDKAEVDYNDAVRKYEEASSNMEKVLVDIKDASSNLTLAAKDYEEICHTFEAETRAAQEKKASIQGLLDTEKELKEKADNVEGITSGRKTIMEKAQAEEKLKKQDYEKLHTQEIARKTAFDNANNALLKNKPAYDEAIEKEQQAKQAFEDGTKAEADLRVAHTNALQDENEKERFYNSKVDEGQTLHNEELDKRIAAIRSMRRRTVETMKIKTLQEADLREYCVCLIEYFLVLDGASDVSYDDWNLNPREENKSVVPISYMKDGSKRKQYYSVDWTNNEDGDRAIIYVSDSEIATPVLAWDENTFIKLQDKYQIVIDNFQGNITAAERAYNESKKVSDQTYEDHEKAREALGGLRTAYEAAAKSAESIKMNYNTTRAIVAKEQQAYEEIKARADRFNEIYLEAKAVSDKATAAFREVADVIARAQAEYEGAVKATAKAKSDVAHHEENAANAKKVMEEKKAEIDNLKHMIEDAEHIEAEAKSNFENAKSEKEAKEAEYNSIKAEETKAKQELDEYDAKLKSIQDNLAAARSEFEASRDSFDNSRGDVDSLLQDYKFAESDALAASTAYENTKAQSEQLNKEYAEISVIYRDLISQYHKMESDIQILIHSNVSNPGIVSIISDFDANIKKFYELAGDIRVTKDTMLGKMLKSFGIKK